MSDENEEFQKDIGEISKELDALKEKVKNMREKAESTNDAEKRKIINDEIDKLTGLKDKIDEILKEAKIIFK